MKSPQDCMNMMMARVEMAGLSRGSTICMKMRGSPAPSILAHSMSSSGTSLINWRIIKMP